MTLSHSSSNVRPSHVERKHETRSICLSRLLSDRWSDGEHILVHSTRSPVRSCPETETHFHAVFFCTNDLNDDQISWKFHTLTKKSILFLLLVSVHHQHPGWLMQLMFEHGRNPMNFAVPWRKERCWRLELLNRLGCEERFLAPSRKTRTPLTVRRFLLYPHNFGVNAVIAPAETRKVQCFPPWFLNGWKQEICFWKHQHVLLYFLRVRTSCLILTDAIEMLSLEYLLWKWKHC